MIAALLTALVASLSLVCGSARADEQATADLVPVTAQSDVAYYCFDNPSTVYSDGSDILVGGRSCIADVRVKPDVPVEGEAPSVALSYEVAEVYDFPADKAVKYTVRGETEKVYVITLFDGKISAFCGEQTTEFAPGDEYDFTDMTIEGDKLYALASSAVVAISLGGDELFGEYSVTRLAVSSGSTATAFTVLNGKVYVATVHDRYGRLHDICAVGDGGKLTPLLNTPVSVLAMSASARDGIIYVLTRSELVGYRISDGSGQLKEVCNTDGDLLVSICAYGGEVFALDAFNALHSFTQSLSVDTVLIASSSAAEGFFNMPSGLSTKHGTLYVADKINSRIAFYGDAVKYSERNLDAPTAVVGDSAGTLYVAYDYDKIGIFRNGNLSQFNERTITANELGIISDIAVDADKNVLALTDNGLWTARADTNYTLKPLTESRYKAITLGVGGNALYALGDDGVYSVVTENGGATATEVCSAPAGAVSIAVDLNGAVYVLTQTSIIKHDGDNSVEYPLTVDGESYTLGGVLGQIAISTVDNAFVEKGDILILDTYKHRLFAVDGESLGVTVVDASYAAPDAIENRDGIIRTALRETNIYALPAEGEPIFSVAYDAKLIVPVYELADAREYAYVLVDDMDNNVLVAGYVYKDCLSIPPEYSDPPAAQCTVITGGTPIYKLPSRNSQPVPGYEGVKGNSSFDMLPFLLSYVDVYGRSWYRISLGDDGEGYIPATGVLIGDYGDSISNILPDVNAEIIEYNGSRNAKVYRLVDGKYVVIENLTVAVGTKVEVVDAFDSTKRYTKIKFLDQESRRTITCYVETGHIKYTGFNVVLIVAIIVIIITVMLLAIVIARSHIAKKRRQEKEDEVEHDE